MARLSYLELPVNATATSRTFYERALGLTFQNFGPSYSATTTGDTDVGLQGDPQEHSAALLPVFSVEDIDSALADVTASGGEITRAIFDYPGGRRFHFRDPDGHEIAVSREG